MPQNQPPSPDKLGEMLYGPPEQAARGQSGAMPQGQRPTPPPPQAGGRPTPPPMEQRGREMSGAAVSDAEMKNLARQMGQPSPNRVNAYLKYLQQNR